MSIPMNCVAMVSVETSTVHQKVAKPTTIAGSIPSFGIGVVNKKFLPQSGGIKPKRLKAFGGYL
jgi:hypothetical protein